ncbi:MAG: archaellin/type IV pilin N-terminal domain-containing protein [archaeon]|jgi:flagellin-like protein
MKLKKKAISPIITIILLVVVAVVIAGVLLSWSTNFFNKNLSANSNKILTEEKTAGYFFIKEAANNKILINNKSPKDITIRSYKIIDNKLTDANYLNRTIGLENSLFLKSGDVASLDIACFPSDSFKINLNTIEDKYIELQVNTSDYDFADCQRYDPAIKITSCPDGYISVPGNANYAISGFCVQQYEARIDGIISNGVCDEGVEENLSTAIIRSSYSFTPRANINLCTAKKICENSGAHLITNNEWMTIARNLEQVSENWTSGTLGSGMIKRGNIGYIYDGGNFTIPEGGYTKDNDRLYGGAVDFGDGRDELARLTLSNGEYIWDFSGNLAEWVDLTIIESCDGTCVLGSDDMGIQHGSPGFDALVDMNWYEFTELTRSGSLTYPDIKPYNDYDSINGVGKIFISPGHSNDIVDRYMENNVHAVVRGGNYSDDYAAGVFAMNFMWAPNYYSDKTGFRCAITLEE